MTLERFREKHSFAKNLTISDIKKVMMFIMLIIMDVSTKEKDETSKMEKFVNDVKSLIDDED